MTTSTTLTEKDHVLIVGGSSGFGIGVARALLGLGARVTIAGRDELNEKGPSRCWALSCL